jgi:hypothetical protein
VTRHQLGQKPAICLGCDLHRPVDRTVTGKWPIIENVVALVDGTAQPRPGLGAAAIDTAPANKTPWHSIRTLNDPPSGTWCRVCGVGDRLCVELSSAPGTITNVLGGWSGNPLSLVSARPIESPQPFMYVADSALMRKVDSAGNLKSIGMAAPSASPVAVVSQSPFNTIDLCEAGSAAGWVNAGGAGAPAQTSAGPGLLVNTTVLASIYDSVPGFGLASIVPVSPTNIVVGSVLTVATGGGPEAMLVTEVHAASAAVAIDRILYDSGTTGLCSIHLVNSLPGIEVNSVLLITGVASAGTEYARVQDVIYGPDGTYALRVATTVARLATDTIAAQACFTSSPVFIATVGGAIVSDGVRSAIAAAVPGPTPATLTKVIALDLSKILTGVITGTSLDDLMSILVRVDAPQNLVQLMLMLDCDVAGSGAGTVFTENYFWTAITASDLTAALTNAQTALVNRAEQLAKAVLNDPATKVIRGGSGFGGGFDLRDAGPSTAPSLSQGPQDSQGFNTPSGIDISDGATDPSSSQLSSGASQFSNIRIRLSQFQRVGTDESRGWKDINSIRIAILTTGALTIDFDAWVVRGGSNTEVSDIDEGYTYRYSGRDSTTGVRGNTSPASLGPVRPLRQPIGIRLTQHPSADCDKLDIERHGGPVLGWRYVGTVDNSVNPTFLDTMSNSQAEATPESEASGLMCCQPWPLVTKPLTGTGAVISGTLIKAASGVFNLSYLRGMPVVALGRQSILRRVLSTSLIEVEDNMGQSASASWELPRPVVTGQPLPILAGDGQDRMFACGDPNDASAYYVTARRNFDITNEFLRFDIPGAILQNIAIYDNSVYIATTEKLYRIDDAGVDALGNQQYRASVVAGSRGLIARWAMCSGDRLYGLDREGIWGTSGAAPDLITDDDLYPLFPHDGTSTRGDAVNGFNPPDLAPSRESSLRLSHGGSQLFFDYIDTAAARRTLEYRIRRDGAPNGWYPHVYTPGVAVHYYEEGRGTHLWLCGGADTPTAKLYALTEAQSDAGTAIVWTGTPQYESMGDPRKLKRWGDYATEIDRDGATVNVTPKFNSGTTALTLVAIAAGSGRIVRIGDLNAAGVVAGSGVLDVNMSLTFGGSVTTQRPKIYGWEPTWLDRPELTALRATDFEDAPPAGSKFVRGVWLTFDSLGATRAASIYRDGVLFAPVTTITGITSESGPKRQYFPFATPFYASTLLVLPTDAATWMLFSVEWVADSAPELTTGPQAWDDLGFAGAKWLQGVVIDADTEAGTGTVNVEGDENTLLAVITPVVHDGRAQKVYTFNPPVLTHLVRANPQTPMHLWPTPPTRWVWEPEPEIAIHYETQQTTHDINETYKILRDSMITLRSTSAVTFSIYDGGRGTGSTPLFTTTIPSTAGQRQSVYVPLTAIKARSFIYVLDGGAAGFALYRKDTWVKVRGWGRPVSVFGAQRPPGWQEHAPFGADSRSQGALV